MPSITANVEQQDLQESYFFFSLLLLLSGWKNPASARQ